MRCFLLSHHALTQLRTEARGGFDLTSLVSGDTPPQPLLPLLSHLTLLPGTRGGREQQHSLEDGRLHLLTILAVQAPPASAPSAVACTFSPSSPSRHRPRLLHPHPQLSEPFAFDSALLACCHSPSLHTLRPRLDACNTGPEAASRGPVMFDPAPDYPTLHPICSGCSWCVVKSSVEVTVVRYRVLTLNGERRGSRM